MFMAPRIFSFWSKSIQIDDQNIDGIEGMHWRHFL